jgi:hypothetical protein
MMLGIMVKLNEASKGNLESVSGMSLENVFNDYMMVFTQPAARIQLFPQAATPTQRHQIDGVDRTADCFDAAAPVNMRIDVCLFLRRILEPIHGRKDW